MNDILSNLALYINNNMAIAPILALFAGILTSFTPCSLSSIPLVLISVGGSDTLGSKKAFKLSLVCALGMAITFTIMGAIAALLGKLMLGIGPWLYIILGILMILMAIQTWGLITIIKPTYLTSKNTKKGYLGALISGIFAGAFSSPCATPVLVVLLSIVTSKANVLWGILLLFIYAVGNSFLVIVAGTSVGTIRKMSKSEKYGKVAEILKYVSGTLILLLGLYMLYLGF